MSWKNFFICTIVVLVFLPFLAQSAEVVSSSFNPNFVLTDEDIFDATTMDATAIQYYLEHQPGTLARYRTIDIDGKEKSAAEIIAGAAKRNDVNPKYLLSLLQKEQSLIEDPRPIPTQYEWATGFGVCDDCDVKHPLVAQYRGFSVQIDRAAWRQGYYRDHPGEFRFQKGKTTMVEGIPITPLNQATANLYNYTPHRKPQERLLVIWNRYFTRKYPEGALLQDPQEKTVWYIDGEKRRPISSRTVLISRFDPKNIVLVQARDLLTYEIGAPVQFPNYSLLRSPNGTIYLFVNDLRRPIVNRKAFASLGFNQDEVVNATLEDLEQIPEGIPLTEKNIFPEGAVVEQKKTKALFYVESGTKWPIADRAFLTIVFPSRKIVRMDAKQLEVFPEGLPIKLPDGTLIKKKESKTIYVVSDGRKRSFASLVVFRDLGYDEKNVHVVTENILTLHDDGEPIDFTSRKTPLPSLLAQDNPPVPTPETARAPSITNPLSLFYGL